MVIGVRQREGGTECDTVAHEVVQRQFRWETVKRLLDNSTTLLIVTSRDTEVSFLTTTRDCYVVILAPSCLLNGLHPIGIVVPVFKLSPWTVIVDFVDIEKEYKVAIKLSNEQEIKCK